MVAVLKTPHSLVLQFVGKTLRVPVDSPAAKKAWELLKAGASDQTLLETVDPLISIRKHTSGLFEINDEGEVFVAGVKLPTALANRLVDFADNALLSQAKSLVLFWQNALKNPLERARTDLYAFLEHNGIPITQDGCFVAYRSVVRHQDGNLYDAHTGKFRNNVGDIVTMPRDQVDSNPDQTCSRGLHVAAFEYAKGFSQVLLEVKVNPADVCAIPTDYNGQKMRVCKFEVVAINAETASEGKLIDRPLYDLDDDGGECDDCDEECDDKYCWCKRYDHDCYPSDGSAPAYVHPSGTVQKRDGAGRFLPKGA